MESTAVLELFFFVDPDAVDSSTLRGGESGGNLQPVKLRIGRRDDPLLVNVEPLSIEPKVSPWSFIFSYNKKTWQTPVLLEEKHICIGNVVYINNDCIWFWQRFYNNPDVRTEDAVTWREIYVGGAVAYDIIVSIPLGAFYTNLSLSVTDLSNLQMPGAHICRARVSHIGRGLPCAQSQQDFINENAIFYSKVSVNTFHILVVLDFSL